MEAEHKSHLKVTIYKRSKMGLLIFYLLLAILFSFLCSILEAVLLSITPSYVQSLSEKNPKLSKQLQELKEKIDRPLAAILSLNTIAHTIGAAGVGAQAVIVFEDISVGVVSAVLTILILVFSEIIPKTLGAQYWRSLAPFTAKALKFLILVLYPFVLLSKWITSLISREEKEAEVSRAEFSAMADLGLREGVFKESEMRVIKNLIAFKDIKARNIMTPRTVVVGVSENVALKNVPVSPIVSYLLISPRSLIMNETRRARRKYRHFCISPWLQI